MLHTRTFTGASYAECRDQMNRFWDEQKDEPWLVRADAHRTGDHYEITIHYTHEAPLGAVS